MSSSPKNTPAVPPAEITREIQGAILAQVIATFPTTFGLRGHPGQTFRISARASYFPRLDSKVPTLYTERLWDDGVWHDFAKGSAEELRREICEGGK